MAKDDNSVIFLKDWKVLIQSLSSENQLYFWDLFTAYEYESNQECNNDYVKPIWNFVKSQLDNMKEKYISKTVKTNQENGKLGGRPKKTQDNPNNPMGYSETQITPKDNNKDNNKEKEKDITPTAFNFYKSLISIGAESNIANDWLKVRKTKKAVNSETAYKGFLREFEKSGKQINDILKICVERSWSGFNSEWAKDIKVEFGPIEGETEEEKDLRIRRESFKNIKVH